MGPKSISDFLVGALPHRAKESDCDFSIIQRVQNGDVSAFDELIVKYRERIYSVIYNITSNREDASDLTQDVFIKGFRSIHSFKSKSTFFTWIYRIAINTTYNHLRKNRLKNFFSFEKIRDEDSDSLDIIDQIASDHKTDKSTLIKELQEKLNEALQTLSIKHRTVIVLYEVEGLDHSKIAKIMNCSEGTVRSRLHYAKKELQSLLKPYIK